MIPGATLPLFSVEDAQKLARGTEVHWQRREMIVLLAHGDANDPCAAVRSELRRRSASLRGDEIAPVILVASPHAEPGEIADVDGALSLRVRTALGLETRGGELIVATRFARLVHLLDAHAASAPAIVDEALEWLRYGQIACEDCSVPLWE